MFGDISEEEKRETLEVIFNNFYRSLLNKAREQKWGEEMHIPLIINMFRVPENIVPEIVKQYDGDKKEAKIKGIIAQLRFSIEIMFNDWSMFLDFAQRKELDKLVEIVKKGKEFDINLIHGFLDNDREKGRDSYIA